MTTEIRALHSEDDLIAAAIVFRTAMVGLPPLPDLPPGEITKLLDSRAARWVHSSTEARRLLDWRVLGGVILAGFSAHPLRAKRPMC